MLNPFPIQFLALLGYFILRVVAGISFLYLGKQHWKCRHHLYPVLKMPWLPFGKIFTLSLIVIELVVGTLFVLGLYTQIAALLVIILSIKMLFLRNKFITPYLPNRLTYFLFFGIGCLLFITGAGIFAFDLPI